MYKTLRATKPDIPVTDVNVNYNNALRRADNLGCEKSEDRRKTIKVFKSNYARSQVDGAFEEDCSNHISEFTEMEYIIDIPMNDRFSFIYLTLDRDGR